MIKVWILTVWVWGGGNTSQQYMFENQYDCLKAKAYMRKEMNEDYIKAQCLQTVVVK